MTLQLAKRKVLASYKPGMDLHQNTVMFEVFATQDEWVYAYCYLQQSACWTGASLSDCFHFLATLVIKLSSFSGTGLSFVCCEAEECCMGEIGGRCIALLSNPRHFGRGPLLLSHKIRVLFQTQDVYGFINRNCPDLFVASDIR